jgi:hypothetical protein
MHYGVVMMAWFGSKKATPSIDSLRFATADWKYHAERETVEMRLWETADHDAVFQHFFGKPPDLPVAKSIDEISAMYASGLVAARGRIVECAIGEFARCKAVRVLLKVPQKPTGMMYQSAVTVPFQDFSFVVRIQCSEVGTTGVREAILFEKRMRAGERPNLQKPGEPFPGWNPDAPRHDAAFPSHPISRLRRLLSGIQNAASIDEKVRQLPAFPLPSSSS